MSSPVPSAAALAGLVDSSARFAVPSSEGLSDDALMQMQRALAEVRRRVDAWSASVAAEIARRSRHELGEAGLARRLGARTPELLVQQLSGATAREAHSLVRVGALIADTSPLDAVGAAVADGQLTLDAADVIRAGLASLDASVPPESLAAASSSWFGMPPRSRSRSSRPARASGAPSSTSSTCSTGSARSATPDTCASHPRATG